jgi:hypothetical protein
MRKRVITQIPRSASFLKEDFLDLATLTQVEVTSEDEAHPIEAALVPGQEQGWRAATPGNQTIRLLFDKPQKIRRILLAFEETEVSRTQEFVLRWSPDAGTSFREIVRQQWTFSPTGSVRETEKYDVDFSDVTVLELIIVPDMSGGEARASLMSWRVA